MSEKKFIFDTLPAGDTRKQLAVSSLRDGDSVVVDLMPDLDFFGFGLASIPAHYARVSEFTLQGRTDLIPSFGFAVLIDGEEHVLWTSSKDLARRLAVSGRRYLIRVAGEKMDRRYIIHSA